MRHSTVEHVTKSIMKLAKESDKKCEYENGNKCELCPRWAMFQDGCGDCSLNKIIRHGQA